MPMILDDNHLLMCGCTILWDGITRPDTKNDGSLKHNLKLALPGNSPDAALLEQLAQKTLNESQFRGMLPAGGRMPITHLQPNDYNGALPGHIAFSAKTNNGVPDIYNENGQQLKPMEFGALLYQGQRVDVLVHCYEYNNAGNKGIGVGLDGFSIIVSANAPRQNFGGNGADTQAVFGGGAQQYQQPPMQQYQQPQGQMMGSPMYGQQPPMQQQYQQPQGQMMGSPMYGQQPPMQQQYQQPPQGQMMGSPMQQQYQQPPMQSHEMLPQYPNQ